VDDRDPRVDAGYARGGVEASTLTSTALDVMTCCDFFQVEGIGCNDNGMGEKGSNPGYIKGRTHSMIVCGGDVMSVLHSPGRKDL
jgi:hypothetical protein